MSDLNWNKLPWRKSSFSSDSANCVEVSWTRSSACHQGSCVEVGWTASSRCAGGDCVQVRHDDDVVYVRDSKLGDDSPVQEWPLTYWEFLCDAIVADLPRFSGFRKLDDGGVELRWAHIHPAPLIFDAGEWKAFVLGVRAGEFDREKLSEGVSAGSGSVAGSGEAATGAVDGSGWSSDGPGSPVPVAAESFEALLADPHEQFDARGELLKSVVEYANAQPLAASAPVAAELGSLDDELDTLISPGSCGCTEAVADAACTEHGMKAFLRALLSIEDTPADRLAGRGSLLPASTPDDPRSGGQPGPYVAEITWSEDPSLGEPQGSPVGRPVDVSTDEVDLSSAVQPGSDAAGTGVPPDPVPAAQRLVARIYVSGAITGRPLDEARKQFEEVCWRLAERGYEPVNPFDVPPHPACDCPIPFEEAMGAVGAGGGHDWGCYLRGDLAAMLDCDAIYMLPGWESSHGARLELTVASAVGLKVMWDLPSDFSLIEDANEWARAVAPLVPAVETQETVS
jgi:hypothetical protein